MLFMSRGMIGVSVIALLTIAAVLAWILLGRPATVHAPTADTDNPITSQSSVDAPLHERVFVSTPENGEAVGKTLIVSGEAPGTWYFEGSFPVQVRDADGTVLAIAVAQAQSDWMTEAQVPFLVTLTIDTSYTGPATLVLLRDNPSGLPEHDDAFEVPVVIQ